MALKGLKIGNYLIERYMLVIDCFGFGVFSIVWVVSGTVSQLFACSLVTCV